MKNKKSVIKAKLAQVEKIKTRIGLLRDDLRDKVDELTDIWQGVDDAHADIDDAISTLKNAIGAMSAYL